MPVRDLVIDPTYLANKLCRPIQTYGGRGVSKKGLRKNDHAIIYTGKTPPKPDDREKPRSRKEAGMRTPAIRVRQRNNFEKMDKMSRVNFAKIYTVEHNVKVYDFGQVHRDDEVHLIANFQAVWNITGGLPDPEIEAEDDDESDENGDSDDTEKGTEPEETGAHLSVSEGKRRV
jgi:hypothetical protein